VDGSRNFIANAKTKRDPSSARLQPAEYTLGYYHKGNIAMPEFSTPAIILDLRDFGESDRIVTAYTKEHGKIKGIAKAAKKSRKRFGAALDLFSLVQLTYFSKETAGLVRLEHCLLLQAFPKIHDDIIRFGYGSYLAELASEMSPEGVPHPDIFQWLATFLSLLDTSEVREEYLRMFEMRLLTAAGYQPALDHCICCKQTWEKGKSFCFSISRGGVVCAGCDEHEAELQPLSLGTAKLLEQSSRITPERIQRLVYSPQAREESRKIIPRFIRYHLGKELNSYKFLQKIEQSANEGTRQ